MPNLNSFKLSNTVVEGNKKAFNEYRKTHGLKECKYEL